MKISCALAEFMVLSSVHCLAEEEGHRCLRVVQHYKHYLDLLAAKSNVVNSIPEHHALARRLSLMWPQQP